MVTPDKDYTVQPADSFTELCNEIISNLHYICLTQVCLQSPQQKLE